MIYVGLANGLFLLRWVLNGARRARDQAYVILLAFLFAFVAFRFEVGCDWRGYLYQFWAAETMSWKDALFEQEPLWWLIIKAQLQLGLSYPWLNVIAAAIFFLGLHTLAKKQPDPFGFLVLLFPILIINMPMSGIRQGAAIGVMCFAFAQFVEGRLVRYALAVLVAAGLHPSALVFLLLAPLIGGRYSRRRLVLAGLLAVPGLLLMRSSGPANEAISRYIDTNIVAFGAAARCGFVFFSAIYFFIFLKKAWKLTQPQDYALAHVGALAMLPTLALVALSTVIGDRFAYFLMPIQAMIFARIPFLRIHQNRAFLAVLPYLGLMLVFAVWASQSQLFSQCYVPYQSWLFGFPQSDMGWPY